MKTSEKVSQGSVCVECGGKTLVVSQRGCDLFERCLRCQRVLHWRICPRCGLASGTRRVACVWCGYPFRQPLLRV